MCEFSRYHEYEYMPSDTRKEHPFVAAPYRVKFIDVMICSYGVTLCSLAMEREVCALECKESCPRYKKYLEHNSHKLPVVWNHETRQMEYGIAIDYNNWDM